VDYNFFSTFISSSVIESIHNSLSAFNFDLVLIRGTVNIQTDDIQVHHKAFLQNRVCIIGYYFQEYRVWVSGELTLRHFKREMTKTDDLLN
jgi:hypothetical protein